MKCPHCEETTLPFEYAVIEANGVPAVEAPYPDLTENEIECPGCNTVWSTRYLVDLLLDGIKEPK